MVSNLSHTSNNKFNEESFPFLKIIFIFTQLEQKIIKKLSL